jgi:putative ABC transport system permease protein
MDGLFQDLRYAVRTLVGNPGFAALTILCLSLGIGVNSAIFSVVDAIAIRPLPFKDPSRLVALYTSNKKVDEDAVSYPDLQDWMARTHSFAGIASVATQKFTVSEGDDSERLDGALVSASLFPMLGIQPIAGRQFRPEEDKPGAGATVLLSHGLWQRKYAGDSSVIGRVIMVEAKPATIVGIMPARFAFPEQSELWMPVAPAKYAQPRGTRDIGAYGRLLPGVSLAAARADMASVAARLATEHPEDKDWSAIAVSMRDDLVPSDIKLIVFTMMGAVTFVLLIACGNVANLLLARATVRQREIAVRAALGAGRGRIVRQLLTESVIIALASAPLGILLAFVGLRWLSASVPPSDIPYYINWDMNVRVVVYTAVIAVVTGLVFGLAPAWHASRDDLHESLKDGGRGSSGSVRRNRLRSGLVVGEIALALVVLVGASLFVRSFRNFETARAGLPTGGLMIVRVFMVGDRYAAPEAIVQRTEELVRRIEALPGVTSVMASKMTPFGPSGGEGPVVPEGVAVEKGKEPGVSLFGVTSHMLKTINQPLVSGRDFTEAECHIKAPVAILNQVAAKRLWPQMANVVGQRFRFINDPDAGWITVIGTVDDFRLFTVRDGKPSPYVFLPYPHVPSRPTGLTIRVAAGLPPASVTPAVRQQIRQADSTMAIYDVATGDAVRADTYWEYRLYGAMFSIFGVIALLLASVGVYGVLSYSVSQRTQEIGVRMALGASRRDVFTLVVGHGARLAAYGIVLGVAGALAVTQVIASLLYNVSATDPLSFGLTSAFLAIVAAAASYVPARRATAVDPMIALRTD